ncbi:MAG: P-II family nitrogen regulator [Candidatus Nitrosopumilus sp. bin_7KS]
MYKIEAIVRNSTFYEVKKALGEVGIVTFSAYQVQISGIHHAHEGVRTHSSNYIPKSKIELLCSDEDKDKIIEIIQKTASTGEKGDGIVFCYKIEKLVKIRDGAHGTEALQ